MDQTLLGFAVASTLREMKVARGIYSRGDPYNRHRKSQRARRYRTTETRWDDKHGVTWRSPLWVQPTSRRAANKKAMSAIVTRRVEAQQEIEAWLRKRGVSWRDMVKTIHSEYRGDWSKIEDAMVRWGHVKQARAA